MILWFYHIYLYFLLFEVSPKCLGSNIVNDVEDWFESYFFKYVMLYLNVGTVVSSFKSFTGVVSMALDD